jgi:hypothetical protein
MGCPEYGIPSKPASAKERNRVNPGPKKPCPLPGQLLILDRWDHHDIDHSKLATRWIS